MKIGVLLAQLGRPEAPTAKALRPYLRQFLSDRRVIDCPPLLRKPILYGIILRVSPRRSARLYERIWSDAGSLPLLYTQAQVAGLQLRFVAGWYDHPGYIRAMPERRQRLSGGPGRADA